MASLQFDSYYNIFPNSLMLWVNLRLIFLLVLSIAITICIFLEGNLQFFLFSVLALFTLIILAFKVISFKNTRYSFRDNKIQKQTGGYNVFTEMTLNKNIQRIEIRQKIWHKKRDIIHLSLKTAGGKIDFDYILLSKVQPWINRILYQLES